MRADVFLSYAREDESRARELKGLLEAKGHSVSWDGDLTPGADYPQQIEKAIREAGSVIVLWTAASVKSHWVLEEATLARDQGKLVPALFGDTELPLGFRLSQTVNLRSWDAGDGHPGIKQLDGGIRALHGKPPLIDPVLKSPNRWLAWIVRTSPTLAAALIVLILANWPTVKTIDAYIVTTRFSFHTTARRQILLDPMQVRSLAVRGFAEVRLPPSKVSVMSSGRNGILASTGLVLRPAGSDPATISITRPAESQELLSTDGVPVRSSHVTLDVPDPGKIGLTLRGLPQSAGVSLPPESQLIATSSASDDPSWPLDQPSVKLNLVASPSDRLMTFTSSENPLRLVLGVVLDRHQTWIKPNIEADRVDFQAQSSNEPAESMIVSGSLRLSGGRSENLSQGEALIMEDVRRLLIRKVDVSADGLRVNLSADVGRVSYGPVVLLRHERFTMLTANLAAAVAAIWAVMTAAAWLWFRAR